MGVFGLVQTRGFCLDGIACLCAPITTTKGGGYYVKVFFRETRPEELSRVEVSSIYFDPRQLFWSPCIRAFLME